MGLDRLGRQTLHEHRYAGPRAISPYEAETGSDDAGFQVDEVTESVSPEIDRSDGRPRAAAVGKGSPEANARTPAPEQAHATGPRAAPQRSALAESRHEPTATTSTLRERPETVDSLIQKELVEQRTEFVTVREIEASEPERVAETDGPEQQETSETGALSQEFAALDARLRSLQEAPGRDAAEATSSSLPTVAPATGLKAPAPAPPVTREHHIEVLIDSIVVNAAPPGETAPKRPSRRSPAEGLAKFQQSRRR